MERGRGVLKQMWPGPIMAVCGPHFHSLALHTLQTEYIQVLDIAPSTVNEMGNETCTLPGLTTA